MLFSSIPEARLVCTVANDEDQPNNTRSVQVFGLRNRRCYFISYNPTSATMDEPDPSRSVPSSPSKQESETTSDTTQKQMSSFPIRLDFPISSVGNEFNLFATLQALLKSMHKLDSKCQLQSLNQEKVCPVHQMSKIGMSFHEYCRYSIRGTSGNQRMTAIFRIQGHKSVQEYKKNPTMNQYLRQFNMWMSTNEFPNDARLSHIGYIHGKATRVTNLKLYVADIIDTLADEIGGIEVEEIPHFQLVPTKLFSKKESAPILEIRCRPDDANTLRQYLLDYPKDAIFGGEYVPYNFTEKRNELYTKVIRTQNYMLNNLYVIPVHGIHWKAMEEEVESLSTMSDDGTELSLTLRESVMLHSYKGQRVFNGVESTIRVDTEGRWIFVTTKEMKHQAIAFIDKEFQQYYKNTAAYPKYQGSFHQYPHPTRISSFQTPEQYVQTLKVHTAPETTNPTKQLPRRPTVVVNSHNFPPLVQPWQTPKLPQSNKAPEHPHAPSAESNKPSPAIQKLQQQLNQSSKQIKQLTTDQTALTSSLTEITQQITAINSQIQNIQSAIEQLTQAVQTLIRQHPDNKATPSPETIKPRVSPNLDTPSQQLTLPSMLDSMRDAPRSPRTPAGNTAKKAKLSILKRITTTVSGTPES